MTKVLDMKSKHSHCFSLAIEILMWALEQPVPSDCREHSTSRAESLLR